MAPVAFSEKFGDKLGRELSSQHVSQRELARRLAGSRDPVAVDIARRAIRKWLQNQHRPIRANRVAIAAALGLERDHFEDDDEEEDAELVRDLVLILRRLVREEVAA